MGGLTASWGSDLIVPLRFIRPESSFSQAECHKKQMNNSNLNSNTQQQQLNNNNKESGAGKSILEIQHLGRLFARRAIVIRRACQGRWHVFGELRLKQIPRTFAASARKGVANSTTTPSSNLNCSELGESQQVGTGAERKKYVKRRQIPSSTRNWLSRWSWWSSQVGNEMVSEAPARGESPEEPEKLSLVVSLKYLLPQRGKKAQIPCQWQCGATGISATPTDREGNEGATSKRAMGQAAKRSG